MSSVRIAFYGSMPGVHHRANKIIYTSAKSHMDGEDATQAITIGTMAQREAFVDQLADVTCVEGYAGLEKMFQEWLNDQKTKKK